MNQSFDLRTQPFIPCLHREGQVRDYSLTDVLTQAHDLLELACDTPLQTVAVLRLLLAVLYRALPIEDDKEEQWAALWRQETLPIQAITDYLNAQGDGFDLFHPTRPFMQVAGLTMTNTAPLAMLATEAATGNNATLFDHRTDDAPPSYSPAQAARLLLAAQAFALGFGKAAEATVDGKTLPRPYLADAVTLRGVTLFLSGDSLRQTLLLNMPPLSSDEEVLLPWEQPDPLADLDKVSKDGKRQSVPALSIVERYAWRSRMVRLLPDPDGLVRRMYFTQGRAADKNEGDPMKVFVSGKKEEGRYALGLNADKAAWRDLQTYLLPNKGNDTAILRFAGGLVRYENNPQGPLEATDLYSLNVVGLATDPGKAGKFLLWRHDRMSLPAALLALDTLRGFLEMGMGDAEAVADSLRQRLYRVAFRFLPPDGNPDPKDVANLMEVLNPRPAYWARLETRFAHFVAGLEAQDTANAALTVWRQDVEREAKLALRESCRQLGDSPRAMKATAAVSFGFTADRTQLAQKAADAKTRKKAKATKQKEELDDTL